jgi:hypothetical protein
MNIIRIIILSLFIFTQSQADTIYNLIKIPNLEIYEINTSNKLRYLYAKQPFTIGVDNNINCFNSEKKVLDEKYEIIQKNLNRYNQKFLKKINLKYIVLCEDLSISNINTAGIPDNVMKTLILDIKFDEKYFERVIHHEVFHIINDSYKEKYLMKKYGLILMLKILNTQNALLVQINWGLILILIQKVFLQNIHNQLHQKTWLKYSPI